jgi:hypothetical protein
MGFLSKGYHTICLSPVFSLSVYLVVYVLFSRITFDWLFQIILSTMTYILVIAVQVCGLILCFVGYRKNESVPFKLILSIILVLWGSFMILWSLGWYSKLLEWSRLPDVRSLTIWDNMEYATSVVMGLLWIASGLVFTAMSHIRKPSRSKPETN